jgi:glycosyltransferase involved in cell wall biosynthesis
MRVLVFPRDDPNPYQRLLYAEMERLGTRVSYLGRLTPSRTLNLLLLPVEVAVRRAGGARLVHLHWVFGFGLPGGSRFAGMRRLAQTWFTLWLRTTRLLGVHIVWTAHNVLPHSPVFADDIAARRALLAASDLVLAHSQPALAGLAALGAVPRKSAIIPHGALAPAVPAASLRVPGTGSGPRRILFFGKVLAYKGAEDLLAAFAAVPAGLPAILTIAGQCDDPGLRSRLEALARAGGERVALRLERIPDRDVPALFASADVVALPYRSITTSGCAMLALAYGRPLVVPELDGFAHLPREAIISYSGPGQALTAALVQVATTEGPALAAMAAAARAYAATLSWPEIALRTKSEMESLLRPTSEAGARGEPCITPEAARAGRR